MEVQHLMIRRTQRCVTLPFKMATGLAQHVHCKSWSKLLNEVCKDLLPVRRGPRF